MKQILTFALLFGFGISLIAQTIVSTTPDNKKVILEEFTGVNCGYCPDGHKISNQLMATYPDELFAINIHQGYYAPTSPASINYTTTYGNAIGTQAGATSTFGYPCGSINRHQYTGSAMVMYRSDWSTYASTAIGESSPVNIAIDVDLDYTTREMSVLVEVYYTATSTASTNKLNVAILQDWIKGPQSGSSFNPTYVTNDGQYWHMHMFRDFLTGQWGVTIPTTTVGTFWDSTFVYTVPATYGAIPVELPNLKVVAFVAEGQTEILTADEMAVPLAPIDACATGISGLPTDICATSFIPTVTIKNKGINTLTSLDIDYSLDGGAVQTFAWTGSLVSGASADVILPSVPVSTSGSHSFEAATNNPNAGVDDNTLNDAFSGTFTSILSTINTPVTQNFTSTTFPPADWALSEVTPNGTNWARSAQGCFAAGSAYINWYSISSGIDDLMSYKMDFTSLTDATLSFNYAYRQYNSSYSDKLQVDVSTNCGASWTTLWTKSGAQLATTTASETAYTTVLASHWKFISVDLSAYDGQSEVMLRFRATSAYGNNLYLDDINISNNVGLNDNVAGSSLTVYPNPANDFTTVSINSASSNNAVVTIVNTIGEVVHNSSTWLNAGSNDLKINTENFDNGVYFIRVQTIDGIMNSSLVVGR